jgi:hypothetical protein
MVYRAMDREKDVRRSPRIIGTEAPVDVGRPYRFSDADQLLADFFTEVRRVLKERGVSDAVVAEEQSKSKEQS